MTKKRVPMQVSPEFRDLMGAIKKKMLANGVETSLRDITEEIAKSSMLLEELEKKILNTSNVNINIRFDKRKNDG
jgi:hypothetical protein